jgi:hypothetical protein
MLRADRYKDSLIFERKPFTWPEGKTLAVWVIPNVEVYFIILINSVEWPSRPMCGGTSLMWSIIRGRSTG